MTYSLCCLDPCVRLCCYRSQQATLLQDNLCFRARALYPGAFLAKHHLYHCAGGWGQPSLPHALKLFSEGYEVGPTHPQEQEEYSRTAGVLVLQLCLARSGQSTMSWGHLLHSLVPVVGIKVLESGVSLQ